MTKSGITFIDKLLMESIKQQKFQAMKSKSNSKTEITQN